MKKDWKEPKLELLDIRETMLGSNPDGHDLLFDHDGRGWVPDEYGDPIFGGGGGGDLGS